jgi:DNA-binding transcriptional regulator YdaS (Cro superfamily)
MQEWHLLRAVRIAGGQAALARACGGACKQQHVWNWINRDRKVPAEFVLAIERATGGQVTRHQLRPDIYPLIEKTRE